MKFVLRWEWASLPRSRFLRDIQKTAARETRNGLAVHFSTFLTNGKRPWSVKALRYLLTGAKKRTERKVGLGRGKLRETDSGYLLP